MPQHWTSSSVSGTRKIWAKLVPTNTGGFKFLFTQFSTYLYKKWKEIKNSASKLYFILLITKILPSTCLRILDNQVRVMQWYKKWWSLFIAHIWDWIVKLWTDYKEPPKLYIYKKTLIFKKFISDAGPAKVMPDTFKSLILFLHL